MLWSLDFYCTRPRLMDLLSELFRDISVTSRLFGRFHAGGPYTVRYPADELAGFHVVQSGKCWLHTHDLPAVRLRAGDFAVLPHGSSRTLTDSSVRAAVPARMVSESLRDASLLISQVAARVGYASAFTAAFKRGTRAAPGAWRRAAATAAWRRQPALPCCHA